MRVLLDEQLPRQFARHLAGHDVRTVQQQSWAGLKNGALLTAAEAAGFLVLVTGDQNLEHQQNLTTRALGVAVLSATSNALEDLVPLVAAALAAIDRVQPGQVIRVKGVNPSLVSRATPGHATLADLGRDLADAEARASG